MFGQVQPKWRDHKQTGNSEIPGCGSRREPELGGKCEDSQTETFSQAGNNKESNCVPAIKYMTSAV